MYAGYRTPPQKGPTPSPRCSDTITKAGPSAAKTSSPPAKETKTYKNRMSEARACVTKAKSQLNSARNLKTEIKTEVTLAIDRLFQLFKELEAEKLKDGQGQGQGRQDTQDTEEQGISGGDIGNKEAIQPDPSLLSLSALLKESNEKMTRLQTSLDKCQESHERVSYAQVAAMTPTRGPPVQPALHSVVVYDSAEDMTGEQVLDRIRQAVKAREGGVAIERVRKAKDGKVIVGCRTEEERIKVKEKLKKVEGHLVVEDMLNKDPQVILRDVLSYNTDEDVVGALKAQNTHLFEGQEDRIVVRYRRKARNPHASHIVLRVSANIWRKMMASEYVHVDLQKIRVFDQSPLVQCSICLGYGHGRRFCTETIPKCSHCGGPHMRGDCADWLAGAKPTCCNCTKAKMDRTEHGAFSPECEIRRKWDTLARSTVAYC